MTRPWKNSLTDQAGKPLIYINDGTGHFHKVDILAFPGNVNGTPPGPEIWGYLDDINNDGILDLITYRSDVVAGGSSVQINYLSEYPGIAASSGSDRLYGSTNDDQFSGQLGNDTIDGGSGMDTAVYADNYADVSCRFDGGTLIVATKTEGTDSLTNIEFLKFADKTVAVADLVNVAPTFSAQSQSVAAAAGVIKAIALGARDTNPGDTLTYTASAPGKGSVSISGATLSYTPSWSATGSDSFVVTASDGHGGTATQTIAVTITARADFRVTLPDGWAGAVGGSGLIYGGAGLQDVTVLSGAVTFDASFNKGGDIIRFAGDASNFTALRSGSSALITAGSALAATIPVGTAGLETVFADGVRKLVYSGGNFTLGTQAFSTVAGAIAAAVSNAVLPTGALSAANASVLLMGNALALDQAAHVTLGGKAAIYGTSAADVVAVAAGKLVNLTFDASFNKGGDTVMLDLGAGSYSAVRSGSSVVLTAANETLTIPVGTAGLTLHFSDGDRTLVYSGGAFKIGDQAIGTAATALTPSTQTISLDVGTDSSAVTLSGAGAAVIFTDDAAKNSHVKLTDFTSNDLIRVTGASEAQYAFSSGDYDGDGVADDLSISYSNAGLGVVNDIHILNVVSPAAFVSDKASAVSAVGFNFISFG
jgi:hypothetical protein